MKLYREKMSPASDPAPVAPRAVPVAPAQPALRMKKKTYLPSAMASLMPQGPATAGPALPSVLEEFESYTAETFNTTGDVLPFWQVRLAMFATITHFHSAFRQINIDGRHYLLSPWTTFQSRHLQFLANTFSPQARKPTHQSATASIQP